MTQQGSCESAGNSETALNSKSVELAIGMSKAEINVSTAKLMASAEICHFQQKNCRKMFLLKDQNILQS